MTDHEERFERWWNEDRFGWRWGYESRKQAMELARAAWNAALTEDVRQTCIEALRSEESEYGGCPSFTSWRKRCAAARKYLEGE